MSRPGQGVGPGEVPIAIIGMDCTFPKAGDLRAFWRLLRYGIDAITDTPATHWCLSEYLDANPQAPDMTYCGRGGFLDPYPFDPTEFGIPPTILEATDTSQLLSLVVAKRALEDAGYGESRELNRDRVSVILGVTGLQELALPLSARLGHPQWRRALAEAGVSQSIAEDVVRRLASEYVEWQESSFPGLLGNVVAGRIANRLNLRGTNCVVDAACASSISAVHLAMMELATGRCDMALTGGVDTLNDIFMYMCFSKTPALSPTGDARPFSDEADGTVLGEGIGMLVLKRLTDARRDGDRIYAVIRSVGTSSDGRSQSIYAPHAGGQARALRNAYAMAGIEPDSIGLIEAHGTGTKVGDAVEFEALRTVFREAASDGAWCALGSVKSQIGHTKAAAGAAGLIKAALALYHRALPPSIKIKAPNAKLTVEDSPFYLSTELRPWVVSPGATRRAGVSSFGFGGSNYHAVLEEHESAISEPAWDGSVEIIALCGDSSEALLHLLESWRRGIVDEGWSEAEIAYRACASRKEFESSRKHRLVLVHELGNDLSAMLDRAATQIRSGSEAKSASSPGLHYGCGVAPGRLAFLYPGQGSQYITMGLDLATRFPEMIEAVAAADACIGDSETSVSVVMYPVPTFSEAERNRQAAELNRTEYAQPALGATAVGLTRVLERFGVRPDVTAGHSYGELPALWAARVLNEESLHQLSRLRGRLMAEGTEDRGTMLAVKAPLTEIERMIAEESLDVLLANRNAPNQGVLSGARSAIADAGQACRRRGFVYKPLAVSGAFHSPAMESAFGPWRKALEAVTFQPAEVPVYSNSTGMVFPDDTMSMRELLAGQLLRPVDYLGMVEQLYAHGVRTFVEVGPRSVLSGLVETILEGRTAVILSVDASSGRRNPLVDLARVLARLAAEGYQVELGKWERPAPVPRKPRMVVPLVGANYRAPRSEVTLIPEQPAVKTAPSTIRSIPPTIIKPDMTSMNEPMPSNPKQIVTTETPTAEVNRLREAARIAKEGIAAMQSLAQQTAAAHQRFLEGQELAHRSLQLLLENQQHLLNGQTLLSAPVASHTGPVSIPATQADEVARSSRAGSCEAQFEQPPLVDRPSFPIESPPVTHIPDQAMLNRIKAGPVDSKAVSKIPHDTATESIVLDVVCEKTGYPREMMDLGMDIEADLGIDSIKRVEIVAAIEERVPEFGGIKPEYMGSIRTLGDILEFIGNDAATKAGQGRQGASEVSILKSDSVVQADAFAGTLMEVVSQLTGYPREMLELSMDMEADLGIDSIKRVEILAGVEARVPEMPAVQPEYMGSLRTLQQIVDYCAGQVSSSSENAVELPKTKRAEAVTPNQTTPVERRILVPVELPELSQPGSLCLADHHVVWITDDDKELAAALSRRLQSHGCRVRIVSTSAAVHDSSDPVCGLILTTWADSPPELLSSRSQQLLRSALLLTGRLAPQLKTAVERGGAILAGIVRMDGRFGLTGGEFDAVQAGLMGLIKTARHEWPGVRCTAIDVSATWRNVEAIADAVLREISAGELIEVGLNENKRNGLELRNEMLVPDRDGPALDGVYLVTGGARGVTAECVVAMSQCGSPTLVLIGRSPVPAEEQAWLSGLQEEADIKRGIVTNEFAGKRPKAADLQQVYERYMANREIARNVTRLRDTGIRVEYRSMDVRDGEAVRAAVHEIVTTYGPVRGLIHAAGVLEDRLIADKSARQFDKVFETKIGGLHHLLDALPLDSLRHIVLFSSVSARFGNCGQSDYAMANEVLNKAAHRIAIKQPDCCVRSINWGPWDGGMVTPALKHKFEQQGVSVIPLEAGAAAFVNELLGASHAVEVVIGSGFDMKPSPQTVRTNAAEQKVTARREYHTCFERLVDTAHHGFLESHVLAGRPVLPLAVAMEWLGYSALHAHPGLILQGYEDVRVNRGVVFDRTTALLRFMTSEPIHRDGMTYVNVELRSDIDDRSVTHVSGTAVLGDRLPAAPLIAYSDALAESAYPRGVEEIYRDVLFHGPHFQTIRKIDGYSSRGIVVQVVRGSSPAQWMDDPIRSEWITDPSVVDTAFQSAILWCQEEMGQRSLPARLERYRQFRSSFPRDGVTVVLEVREQSSRRMICDATFFDLDAAVVARIDGYECTVDASLTAAFGHSASIES